MKDIVEGGKNVYGFDIGIIMLETRFPRILGDIGNAKTFSYPVLYDIVKGYKPDKVVLDLKWKIFGHSLIRRNGWKIWG